MPEECPVRDGGLLGCDARVAFVGVPSVEVGVEVDHADGAIDWFQRTQDGEDNAVVAAEGENSWVGPGI